MDSGYSPSKSTTHSALHDRTSVLSSSHLQSKLPGNTVVNSIEQYTVQGAANLRSLVHDLHNSGVVEVRPANSTQVLRAEQPPKRWTSRHKDVGD